MRLIFAATAMSLALAACAGEPDAESAVAGESIEPAAGEARPAGDEAGQVRLTPAGIDVTGPLGTALAFGSPRKAVESELAKILGPATLRNSNDECGAGPMEFSDFRGGLTTNFQDGRLVGWYFEGEKGVVIATGKGITVGSPEGELVAAYNVEMQEDSTLGDEFYTESGIGGFLTGENGNKSVESLYAGINCFFR
ncbi:MAG: aspartate-semialdehyde dehydrogenase [Sphingomonadaceae bacterium]|nr:aspartate-semialdehyde dehydrogenase [Sphingomonadaceae bacterium]MCP5383762.1 aspartate-semialdehyde dehydrogenase [Altererythrobacter sp.]MCP5394353.1 aspartate-semialdehyde dehydrogenase [Sphingomonadaceae bacterium]